MQQNFSFMEVEMQNSHSLLQSSFLQLFKHPYMYERFLSGYLWTYLYNNMNF